MSYVFDASSILVLTRELGEKVIDAMKRNLTASLSYYEIGNALWKECSLLKRLSTREAAKTLKFAFTLLKAMKVVDVKNSHLGIETLNNAAKSNITYYDAVYLTIAREFNGVLVTDDEKLTSASKENGVKTLTSKSFVHKRKI